MVDLGTPGGSDGRVQAWVDGQLRADVGSLRFRETDERSRDEPARLVEPDAIAHHRRRMLHSSPIVVLASLLFACGGSQSSVPEGSSTFSTSSTDAPMPRNETDAPEISRSAGEEGGVVLLWPRVVPRDARDDLRNVASSVQTRLQALIQQAAPTRAIDERPEPERVCPRSGCVAPAVGALLLRSGEGCAAFLLVSAAGTTPTGVVNWIGEATIQTSMVPFREPPEAQVRVTDFVPCADLETHLADHETELLARLREELP